MPVSKTGVRKLTGVLGAVGDEHLHSEGRGAEHGESTQKGSRGNNSLVSPGHAHPRELGLQHQPCWTSKSADGEGGDRRKPGQIPGKKLFYPHYWC